MKLGDKYSKTPHWVLITKNVVPESQYKTYDEQKQLVQKKGLGNYDLPNIIEATASIFTHNFKTDEFLYGEDVTRCHETVTKNQWPPTAIGGFSPGGLNVYHRPLDYKFNGIGAAAVRKFF